ncbi:MAG TPA: EAL domain-containing protein [Gammaproteobacteria bacterium]|nr:EAL domain-containing protein [Gammaproteobacteria bacterium]
MPRRLQIVWPAVALPILGLACLLHWGGRFARLENAVAETRATLLAHERPSDIVIVGIDARSLRALSEWPWPRRHHARLLQQLARAEPDNVFVDIEFSSHSSEEDDALLEKSLAEWPGEPVFLATHFQPLSGADDTLVVTPPLERFAAHARLASVVLEPDTDGFVREMRSSWRVGGENLQSIFAFERDLPAETAVPIDFSIEESSFGYLSYIDVLSGAVADGSLRGKTVYVGPTAVELRDILPVPVYRALPGVVLQAFATESARAGILKTPPAWGYALALAVWTAFCAMLFNKRGWRSNSIIVVLGCAALAGSTLYLYAAQRFVLEIVPFALVLGAMFVAATIRSLDRETWRALAYAVGLKRRDALLKSVVEFSSDCIVCVSADGTIRTANPATAHLFEWPHGALLGANLVELVPDLLPAPATALDSLTGVIIERTGRTKLGRRLPVEIALSRVATENGLFTAVVRDVSEREAQQRALEHQATHDSLTGLPNRAALMSHLTSCLAGPVQRHVALLMLDLCRFKEVNDTLGHDVGDDVLREVSRRFAALIGESVAFIGRIGGDEFTIVLAVDERATIDDLSRRLVESLRAPISARGIAIEVGVSIGIAIAPDDARDAKELLRHADVAMYVAKRQGNAYEYYDRGDDDHTVRRLSMLSELRSAIDNSGITLAYQPQVNLRTGRTDSVEALVRWQHATHGSVGPAEFVTLAESTDLIRPLTDWTIRQALADLAAWNRRGLELRAAVNVSARVLQDVGFPARLAEQLGASPVRPHQLELEITESAMLVDPDRARKVVRDLHELGVLIAIDDYGTGFSSLGYLRDLRVHALKLDKSFVVDLESREQNRVIVESTLQMAHALGLKVVAEGVESQWVKDYLTTIGYDLGQGFWFARPMPAEECANWAQRFNAAPQQRLAG